MRLLLQFLCQCAPDAVTYTKFETSAVCMPKICDYNGLFLWRAMRLSYLLRAAPLYDMQFIVYTGQGGRVIMIYICVPEVPGSNLGCSETLT